MCETMSEIEATAGGLRLVRSVPKYHPLLVTAGIVAGEEETLDRYGQ